MIAPTYRFESASRASSSASHSSTVPSERARAESWVTGALVGRTRGYNGEGNAAPRRRSSIDAGLARPNQLGESLSQLVQAADDAEGVPY